MLIPPCSPCTYFAARLPLTIPLPMSHHGSLLVHVSKTNCMLGNAPHMSSTVFRSAQDARTAMAESSKNSSARQSGRYMFVSYGPPGPCRSPSNEHQFIQACTTCTCVLSVRLDSGIFIQCYSPRSGKNICAYVPLSQGRCEQSA